MAYLIVIAVIAVAALVAIISTTGKPSEAAPPVEAPEDTKPSAGERIDRR